MGKLAVSRKLLLILACIGLAGALLVISLILQLDFPRPTGPYAVGRTERQWVDPSRPEALAEEPGHYREAPVQIWYPAEKDSGTKSAYFPNLNRVAKDLAASGEVAPLEVWGLQFIQSDERYHAQIASEQAAYPLVILSPGNGTNVEFYSGTAEELASHGMIVVGINHPYDVAAAALQDGKIARFSGGPEALSSRAAWVAGRITVRTEDVLFVYNQLRLANDGSDPFFSGRLDMEHVAVMGHSLGGITAMQACLQQPRFSACLNLDGIQRGGPFSADDHPVPPEQTFMMITKESQLPPASLALFEATVGGSYRVVIPAASHDSFTDGPLLNPTLLPGPNAADANFALIRAYTLAFFNQTLKGEPDLLLQESCIRNCANAAVSVEKYPAYE